MFASGRKATKINSASSAAHVRFALNWINSGLDMQPKGCIIGRWTRLDKVFKALADPGRRQLLDRLHADNGQTLGQLCERMDMTRQAVTKHLKVLEEASLVVTVAGPREAALPQPGADPRDRRTLDRQIRASPFAGARGAQERPGGA